MKTLTKRLATTTLYLALGGLAVLPLRPPIGGVCLLLAVPATLCTLLSLLPE